MGEVKLLAKFIELVDGRGGMLTTLVSYCWYDKLPQT